MKRNKWARRVLLATAVLLVLILVGGGGFYWWFTRAGLPQVDGTVETGVSEEVEIYRDDYGVPHVLAAEGEDLFFAQGYLHAQDRLWQMDMSRRGVSGQLSEILGEEMLDTDRFSLTVGFKRAAEKSLEVISPESRDMLEAYARGVNTYLEENKDDLSPEFRLLRYQPEPWEPVDSLAISNYMAWYLGGNMETELFLSALIAHVGEDKAQELFPHYPQDAPTVVEKAEELSYEPGDVSDLTELSRLGELGGMARQVEGLGSNNWVISGEHTESGNALLANDMHLGMDHPSIWYTQHLVLKDEFNVTGAMFPGIPGIIAGFNEDIAWGLTNVGPDVQDLYEIKFDKDKPDHYHYQGELKEAEVLEKEIPVDGREEAEILEVTETHHGPVVSDVVDLDRGRALSLRWTALDPTTEADMLLDIARARNWEEFGDALENFKAPAQNFVYADKEGNIGYRANGRFPIRKEGEGLLPAPGDTDRYEWEGYVPWEEIPQLYNPPEGMIVTANHQVVDDDYPYFITHEWAAPYRALGIKHELEKREELTLEDMKEIQASFYNTQAEKLLPVILEALEGRDLGPKEDTARDLLADWQDRPVDEAELAAPLIYHFLYLAIIENTFQESLGETLYERLLHYRSLTNVVDRKLQSGESSWFQEGQLEGEEARDEIIARSFEQVVEELQEKQGSSPENWEWGEKHTITFEHDMSEIPVLARLLNRGPYPVGGSPVTPANMSFPTSEPFQVTHSAPWRYVVDVKENRGYDVLATGNSGHPFSAHYDDQLSLWLEMEHKPMPFTLEEVRQLDNRLLLKPD